MNLSQTAMSYHEQFPGGSHPRLQQQEQRLERLGQVAFGGLGFAVLIGVGALIYKIVTEVIIGDGNIWLGVFSILFLVFALLSLSYVILRESLNEKKSKGNPEHVEKAMHLGPDTRQLGLNAGQPGLSIVEDTTELLPIERKKRIPN